MQILSSLSDLRAWRASLSGRLAFVPTMGNLHAGHLALVEAAARRADHVVVSIYVNPTQFGPQEDFARYPRTPEQDLAALAPLGVAAVFCPADSDMYPDGLPLATQVSQPALGAQLCGAHRPGHFDGVALVVVKLLNMVQPDVALFGRKDFQQLAVIRRLVRDLSFGVEIEGIDTVRAADGLALSSRNQYLTPGERAVAPSLYQALQGIRDAVLSGEAGDAAILRWREILSERGFVVEYLELLDADRLVSVERGSREAVVLVAARIGATRLIDNLVFRLA